MTLNVGAVDRLVRIVLGLALAGFALFAEADPIWRIIAGVLGVVALVTAFVRYCPVNAVLGINTASTGK